MSRQPGLDVSRTIHLFIEDLYPAKQGIFGRSWRVQSKVTDGLIILGKGIAKRRGLLVKVGNYIGPVFLLMFFYFQTFRCQCRYPSDILQL